VRIALLFALAGLLALNACAANGDDNKEEEVLGSSGEELAKSGDGISTCGAAHNESCSAKLAVKISDSKTILLGKYDITAGRFRDFVSSTNGDFRGYIDGHKPAWWNGPWAAKLAAKSGVGNVWNDVGGYGYDWSVWLPQSKDDVDFLVGPWNFGINAGDFSKTGAAGYSGESDGAHPAVDWSMYGPANEGCEVGDYGARTYWQPNGATQGDDNAYSQSVLDRKALNCTSFYLLAAFCAWDGGRLPTTAELDAAWGAETYPWGETAPYYADFQGNPKVNGPKNLANYGNSAGVVYANPAQIGNDDSNHVSIPGDFPKGNGPYGHSDLAGNLIAMTGDIAQATALEVDGNNNTNVTVTNAPVVRWHRGGSWQGHEITASSGYNFIATNKYIAMGGRCAYDTGAPAASAFPAGFTAQLFNDQNLASAGTKRVDPFIASTSAIAAGKSVRWTATLTPRYSETYTFTSESGDGMRVWVNGTEIINDWTSHAVATKKGTIKLTANTAVSIKVEHYNASHGGSAKLLWSSPSQLQQVVPASALKPQ
jgi:hypothetical protein